VAVLTRSPGRGVTAAGGGEIGASLGRDCSASLAELQKEGTKDTKDPKGIRGTESIQHGVNRIRTAYGTPSCHSPLSMSIAYSDPPASCTPQVNVSPAPPGAICAISRLERSPDRVPDTSNATTPAL